ncbi:hypothetical protein F4679DRAFT_554045 [Xylaria curta]|nr:hypothetical protein F4679DRAFT_554045 [Xylaria curta]
MLTYTLCNTFPATVFGLFGGFWFTFGATIVPNFGAYGTYSTSGVGTEGLNEPQFYATFSFFLVAMTLLCAVFTVASIRTNVVLFLLLLLLVPTCKQSFFYSFAINQSTTDLICELVGCLSASFFAVAHGLPMRAKTLQHVGAGLLFAVSLLGWYIFSALVLLGVDFPFMLPLGDLSNLVPPRKDETRGH